jgi:hypothetical protein
MNDIAWKLNTVFLDGECEQEGHNIEANVALLISAFQHPQGIREASKHDDGLDDQFMSLLAEMRTRHRQVGPTTPKKTTSNGRIVRKRSTPPAASKEVAVAPVDRRVAVRDLLYGVEQLARIVPRLNRVAVQAAPRCPHCKLFENDPKFFEVPVTADGKSVYAVNAARGKAITYGNLPLGITSKDLALDQLWLAVAKLQLPTYASLTLEQRAACCREHFLTRIGLPPWMEQLLESERMHRQQIGSLEADLDILKERNAEVRNEIRRQQRFLQMASSLKDTMNQEHERTALLGQLAVAKAELVDKRWQLEEAARKNARDKIHHDVETGLVALRTEEIQRLLVSLSMMCDVLDEADATRATTINRSSNKSMSNTDSSVPSHPKQSRGEVREKIIDILGNVPSAEFGRSCRRSAGANKHPTSRFVQCKHCMLPLSYSPYCGVTGNLHQEQLDVTSSIDADVRPPTSDEAKMATPISEDGSESSNNGSDASSPTHAGSAREQGIGGSIASSMEASRRKGSASGRGSASGEARRSLRRAPSTVSARSMSGARPAEAAAVDGSKQKRHRRKGKKDADSHLGSPDSTESFPVPMSNSAIKSLGSLETTDSAPDISASSDLFSLFGGHTCRFVEAASRSDFTSMKLILEEVDGAVTVNATSAEQSLTQRFPATCAALFDLEERFMEWIYALSLEPPPPQHTPPHASHINSESDSGKLVRLKKDLRELQHSFAKRPNARSQGINLDEEAFAAIAFRTMELERKVNHLKTKLLFVSTTPATASSGAVSAPTDETPLTPTMKAAPHPPPLQAAHAGMQATPNVKPAPLPLSMSPQQPTAHHNFAAASGRAVRMDYGSAMI